jgi:hypothetical protein
MYRYKSFSAAALSLFFLLGCQATKTLTDQVQLNGITYKVEIADDSTEISTGLMNRTKLPTNQGMLFVFDTEQNKSFWMKNTYVPLDIIFISASQEIINIRQSAAPCQESDPEQINCPTFTSLAPAKYVLEINAGQSKVHNFQPGDKIQFDLQSFK